MQFLPPAINKCELAPLKPRYARFVEEYLVDLRPRAAAIRAGYSERTAAQAAWRLLHDPLIAAHIRAAQHERSDRLRVSLDRVVREHARIGLADLGRLVRFTRKGPRLRPRTEIGPDDTAALREVTRGLHGFQVKLHDKGRSLEVLTKMLGVVQRFQPDPAEALREHTSASDELHARIMRLVERTDPAPSPGGTKPIS